MSFEEFHRAAKSGQVPPTALTPALRALWLDANNDWEGAHSAAQSDSGQDGAWVHAYLHRKEGDLANAGYWYRRAGRSVPPAALDLQHEWAEIARVLLGESSVSSEA